MFYGSDLRQISLVINSSGQIGFRFIPCGIFVLTWVDLRFHEQVCAMCSVDARKVARRP